MDVDFWAKYVILEESQGVSRTESLAKIEAKFGADFRGEVETKLTA